MSRASSKTVLAKLKAIRKIDRLPLPQVDEESDLTLSNGDGTRIISSPLEEDMAVKIARVAAVVRNTPSPSSSSSSLSSPATSAQGTADIWELLQGYKKDMEYMRMKLEANETLISHLGKREISRTPVDIDALQHTPASISSTPATPIISKNNYMASIKSESIMKRCELCNTSWNTPKTDINGFCPTCIITLEKSKYYHAVGDTKYKAESSTKATAVRNKLKEEKERLEELLNAEDKDLEEYDVKRREKQSDPDDEYDESDEDEIIGDEMTYNEWLNRLQEYKPYHGNERLYKQRYTLLSQHGRE